MRPDGEFDVEVFYADPVDEDGNVIGTAWLSVTSPLGTVRATKVPPSEIAIEDMPTIHVDLRDAKDGE